MTTIALSKISSFNWENLLSRVHSQDVERAVKLLRAKSNEISANTATFVKPAAPIDFPAYKNRLRFTSGAVDAIENSYKTAKLPTYSATVPPFEAKKRELLLNVAKSTVAAAEADLVSLRSQLELFEENRINIDTTVGDMRKRFPHLARDIEGEIKGHEWCKDV